MKIKFININLMYFKCAVIFTEMLFLSKKRFYK
ncbi:hypothetical protein N643_01255 [Salmonella bongori serovar 48:z41:-- str. RKS3044]|nr:hypothetical protein N643_01255 [Salmonella bongori serovar 48:z41:-- str. RKS3044]